MDNRLSLLLSCEEILWDAVAVVGDDAVGYIQDLRSRAVVFIKDYVLVRSEIDKQVRPCASPLVDCLVGIADNEKISVAACKAFYKIPIIGVAVLRLIDHYIVERLLPPCQSLREPVQDISCKIEKVVEIQGVIFHLAADVSRHF